MKILLQLFHISFYPSFFLVLCTANWAYASSSIEGKKLILDATGFGKSEPFIKTFYFLPNNSVTDDEWEHGAYTWIESGATGTVVLEDDGNKNSNWFLICQIINSKGLAPKVANQRLQDPEPTRLATTLQERFLTINFSPMIFPVSLTPVRFGGVIRNMDYLPDSITTPTDYPAP